MAESTTVAGSVACSATTERAMATRSSSTLSRWHEPVAERQPGPPLRRREATDHQAFVSTMTGITRSVFSWYSLKFGMSAAC